MELFGEISDTMLDQMFLKVCDSLRGFDTQLNENFKTLQTNFERFRFIWCPSVVHADIDRLLEKKQFEPKDSHKSQQCRQQGNDEFKKHNFRDSLLLYTQSIRFAHNPKIKSKDTSKSSSEEINEELALAYANRSAAFYQLDEFNLCLNDVESALKFGYPEKGRDKLVERKLHCFYKLERYKDIQDYINANKQFNYNIFKIYEEKLKELKIDLDDARVTPSKKSLDLQLDGKLSTLKFVIPEEEMSSKLERASKKVSMDYTVNEGFHFKAAEDLKAGELIIDEPPYASVLIAEHIKHNCYECMKPLDQYKMNITFCRQCSYVTYCGEECEKASWHSHRYECKYLKLIAHESGLSHMEWLAMRIVTKASFKYLFSIKDSLVEYEDKFERGDFIRAESSILPPEARSKKYKSDAYFNVFHLITNSLLRRSGDLFRRSYIALFITKILVKSGFIGNAKSVAELRDNACFVGGLVLRHLQSISCNAHEISQLKLNPEEKKPLEKAVAKGIGAGIYALLSIFNHSCEPHVTRNFIGSRCQVRMIRNANKNDEIFDNYGVIYAVNPFDERYEKLVQQYFFTCRCRPCTLSWPLYEKIPSDITRINIICPECKTQGRATPGCSQCENELDSVRVFQFLSEKGLGNLLCFRDTVDLQEVQTQKKVALIYDSFCEYLQILDEYDIKRPFREINDYQEALKQCLNLVHMKINSS